MDAKPQRPMRSLRVHGDENAPPAVANYKTLHQRNKSSPALSSMHQAGALKANTKRTAFGDVSNTINANRPSKDDSAIPGKPSYEVRNKVVSLQEEKRVTTALLRPAQRPLSVAGIKSVLNNVTNPNDYMAFKESDLELQPVHTRKLPIKRHTTIFKDPAATPTDQTLSHTAKPLPPISSLAPVHRDLIPQPLQAQEEVPREIQHDTLPSSRPQKSAVVDLGFEAIDHQCVHSYPEEIAAIRSDGVYIDDDGALQICQYTDETDDLVEPVVVASNGIVQFVDSEKHADQIQSAQIQEVRVDKPEAVRSTKVRLSTVSEPEEYWDDEEEEGYEEDGYVTAKSYKSRGENTTGGATTILFPKINQKVRRELAAAKDLIERSRTVEDIEDETWDTSMVAEYGEEIFQYMRDLEVKMLPNAHYMDNQAEIQWSMRSILMDWIVQVHTRFGLLPETLFLCANYIDRFLSCKIVSLGKLQLVGATAIFVAAKYEEINCPSIQEIVYMVDNGYTSDEILKAERFMLSMLQFELGWPGPMSFLRRISKADDYDLETRTLAKYFLEVTIMDERFIGSPPSFAAAGAHCLARMMLKKGHWSPAHVYYSDYTYSQLHSLVKMITECLENPLKHHQAVYTKYADKRFKRASCFAQGELQLGFRVTEVATNNAATLAGLYDDQQIWAKS